MTLLNFKEGNGVFNYTSCHSRPNKTIGQLVQEKNEHLILIDMVSKRPKVD